YFDTYDCRTEVLNESLVIGRYSVLPFYKELEKDLNNKNCKLINSYNEHNWIASFDWYFSNEEIRKYTPKSWLEYDLQYIKNEYEGPYVVKGQTNSRKHNWNTHMYAETFKDLINVISNLKNDVLICNQTLIIRKYEKLKTLEIGVNGLPFTNEW